LQTKVNNWFLYKYDPQKEAELRSWIEGLASLSMGPDFQKGLKDRIILYILINKLQLGSVPKINHSVQNWHQLENLSNFIKAMVSYGMNPIDLFEGKAKTKGLQSVVDIANFNDATMKARQCVVGLQMGTNKCASQSGMRRQLYNPTNHTLSPMDHSTISLQIGTNKCASQVGMMAPGMWWHICDTKLETDKCDNSSMSLQMGYMQSTNQSGQVFGLGWQCLQNMEANGAPLGHSDCPGPREVPEYPSYYQEEAGY
uniref:Calponin-2 n=1 Tax=Saimiri boliviensis boliviensis TaxID=39432 RepID=A0A2K6TKN0_SAIBB